MTLPSTEAYNLEQQRLSEVHNIVTDRISHFIADTDLEDIPRKALDLACLGITDFCGVAVAGSHETQSRLLMEYANAQGGRLQANAIAGGFKTSSYLAALVNGTSGHSLDYDDIAISLIGHPSVFLAPAILAIAETIECSGEEILAAYVIGYETACYLAKPLLQSHYMRGWHSTATFGTLGAAAAVSHLLKLDVGQIKHALGIAASLAGGLRQNFGTMTKPLHAGKAAADGIQAALLAQNGFTADENIIEAPMGFAAVFGHTTPVDWASVTHGLGREFLIAGEEGLAIKPYPSCGFTHTAIEAALQIKQKHALNSADIVEIELGVSPFDCEVLIHHDPKTGLEGKFSLEYCVARALVSGRTALKDFTDKAISEAPVRRLIKKMKWVEKYPLPEMGTAQGFGTKSVAVRLRSGRKYQSEVAITRGTPLNPLTKAEFKAKYIDCVSGVLGVRDAEMSFAILSELRIAKNVKQLMRILSRGASHG